MADHPDQLYAQSIIEIAKNGFHYGIERQNIDKLPKYTRNLPTAYEYPKELDEILTKELRLGRIFCNDKFNVVSQIKIGTVPKSNGKRRLVRHGTWPYNGTSVNSLIHPDCASISLPTLIDICKLFLKVGKGAWICKEDLKSAYRQFGVHHDDWPFVTYRHRGRTLIDTRTADGIRSSGSPCQNFGSALIYITNKRLPKHLKGNILNYIDDYIFAASNKSDCKLIRDTLRKVFKDAGIEYSPDKAEGPDQMLKVLGYFYDLLNMIIKLDDKRRDSWTNQILAAISATVLTCHDIESLIGKMEYAGRVAWPLKAFIGRMRKILPPNHKKYDLVELTDQIRSDLKTWIQYIHQLNGLSLELIVSEPKHCLPFSADACDYSFGAFLPPMWIYGQFRKVEVHKHITWKEMYAICCAFKAWAPMFSGLKILISTDNEAVFYSLKKKYSPNVELMNMIVDLCLMAIKYQFRFWVTRCTSKNNFFSDALSRMEFDRFVKDCARYNMPYNNEPSPFERPNYTKQALN